VNAIFAVLGPFLILLAVALSFYFFVCNRADSSAYDEGFEGGKLGLTANDCPYNQFTEACNHREWMKGLLAAQNKE